MADDLDFDAVEQLLDNAETWLFIAWTAVESMVRMVVLCMELQYHLRRCRSCFHERSALPMLTMMTTAEKTRSGVPGARISVLFRTRKDMSIKDHKII